MITTPHLKPCLAWYGGVVHAVQTGPQIGPFGTSKLVHFGPILDPSKLLKTRFVGMYRKLHFLDISEIWGYLQNDHF